MIDETTKTLNKMSIIEYFSYCMDELIIAVRNNNSLAIIDLSEDLRILKGTIEEDIEFRGC